jgi:hypothetical protein
VSPFSGAISSGVGLFTDRNGDPKATTKTLLLRLTYRAVI